MPDAEALLKLLALKDGDGSYFQRLFTLNWKGGLQMIRGTEALIPDRPGTVPF
jgi:hypothetical protein